MRDDAFIRGKVPMTKEEIRTVSLAKLELKSAQVLYDIGAGTGSVSVEAAIEYPGLQIYAIEQKEEACRLILQNREKFGVNHLQLIQGTAPEQLHGLPVPDCVFIGGTGHRMAEILNTVLAMNPRVRIVMNLITLESITELMNYCRTHQLEPEVTLMHISKSRALGSYHLLEGQNPVYIIAWGGPSYE